MEAFPENPDRLDIPLAKRSGSIGCAVVFLFLAVAILAVVLLVILGVIHIGKSTWAPLIYLPFVLVLLYIAKSALIGLALQHVVIDRKERTFTEHYGSGTGRTRKIIRRFGELSAVILSSHTHHSQQGGSTRYFDTMVRFVKPGTSETGTTRLGSFAEDYFRGRELAEQVAKFCHLPLEDSAMGGETAIRAPEDLDRTLKGKGELPFSVRPSVERPKDARSVIRDDGNRIEILFPPYRLQVGCFVCLAFVAVWVGFALSFFLPMVSSSGGMAPSANPFEFTIGLIMVAVPTLLALFFLVLAKGRRQRLVIRADTVEHEMYRILPRKRVILPRDCIEEIIMGRGTLMDQGPFIIRSDRAQITVENTVLSKAERQYLRNYIENALRK